MRLDTFWRARDQDEPRGTLRVGHDLARNFVVREARRGAISTPVRRVTAAPVARVPLLGMRAPTSSKLHALRRLGDFDGLLLLCVAALVVGGLVMVYSASQLDQPGDPAYWVKRQAWWVVVGVVVLMATAHVPYARWRRMAPWLLLLAVVLLLAVLRFGWASGGAQRWLSLGPLSFQPSELAKFALVIFLADWLVRRGEGVRSWRCLLPFGGIVGCVLLLILLQNDMGTSLVVGLLALAMLYAAGARGWHVLTVVGLGGVLYFLVIVSTPFRRARLDDFINPLPPRCAGAWQVCQGLISLGSGGIGGRGLGDSVQKAGYLPNPFTDSIFAVIGEELGLLGCMALIGLFALLAYRGLRIGRQAPDAHGALLACGMTCWLVGQAFINIGSVVVVIPFTGVPLPFVSSGGSSLVMSLAAVGVLLNISRHAKRATPVASVPLQARNVI